MNILLLIVLLYVPLKSNGVKYHCGDDGENCWISDLKLTRDNYVIEPEVNNPHSIERLHLRSSTIPILSKKICEVLPNLYLFEALNDEIEEIEEGAFQKCKKVTHFDLDWNNFKKLERNTFKGLKNIKEIDMADGNIPIIDLDLSASRELTGLKMYRMNIVIFPADTLLKQKKLRSLHLPTNNLFDLDVETILKYSPNLKYVNIQDNNFKCSRLEQIHSLLADNDVQILTSGCSYCYRFENRSYPVDDVDGVTCLSDEQWAIEFSKLDENLQQLTMKKSIDKMEKNETISTSMLENLLQNLYNRTTEIQASVTALEKKVETTFEETVKLFYEKFNELIQVMGNRTLNQ